MDDSISIIILTLNEEIHIERCIKNLQQLTKKIIIIDSNSTDRTAEIASELGAQVIKNPWPGNYALQYNWALENCNVDTEWTMRMDCDEYLTQELIEEIKIKLPKVSKDIGGIIIKRRVFFMNRWIKHGGFYPHRLLRIWRTGRGKLEDRWMDEHVILDHGNLLSFNYDLVDNNLKDLTWWISKHNNYANREMKDLLAIENNTTSDQNVKSTLLGEQYSKKRWIKEKVYSRIPLFVRPFLYFFYRYFILLGFLDGKPGLIWHFLQAFWYRFLVDAKVYEFTLKDKNT